MFFRENYTIFDFVNKTDMKTINDSILSDHKFTTKELSFIKSEMKKDGFRFDTWVGKFVKKDKDGKFYMTIQQAYERIAMFSVLEQVRTLLYQNGIKPKIADTGTLYIQELDVRISNHVASGYCHAEKFGFNKYDIIVGAFTNPIDVINQVKLIN